MPQAALPFPTLDLLLVTAVSPNAPPRATVA
jgi:hypothetical protein